jgi:dTDP-4-amino-4,6-dideoxygalactose transaminase
LKNKPAILGGDPVAAVKIGIVRPVLPKFEQMADGIQSILTSGMVTKGKYLAAFEEAVADHLRVKHAVAVSSCTSGLMLAYTGLDLQGEVIVPSFTFMATISSLIWAGLRPVFVDVDRDTTNLNPMAIAGAITSDTSGIVAVHNFGNPADIDKLEEIAHRHQLKLIFDAAHGFGSLYRDVPVGPQGDAQVYSLSPTKLLIAGEGGIVATNNDDLAERIRIGREYGNDGHYNSIFAGINARMPEFNALMGLYSLAGLEDAVRHRNRIAALYHQELGSIPGVAFQKVLPGNRCSYKDFSITIDHEQFGLTRDELAQALAAENVDTRNYYDPPVHAHTAYLGYYYGVPLPETEWLSRHSLSLPIWSHMEEGVALNICRAIRRIQEHAQAIHKVV